MVYDGLHDQETDQAMGSLTESWYDSHPVLTRAEQDAFAARSHQRASWAQRADLFGDEARP